MISFFRRIRRKLFTESKFSKYLIYAIGEIILVVIGILIALQINNWNQQRIQASELDDLKKSISSAILSDIKYLELIRTGRESIGLKADSIFSTYIISQKSNYEFNDYAYIANTFEELKNIIYYQPNRSAFEALKNSIYLSKLQATDIELLLNAYYAAAERIQKREEDYNHSLNTDIRSWSNKFRNKNGEYFIKPWDYLGKAEIHDEFLNILNDNYTKDLLAHSFEELDMIALYDQQIILGKKYIEMVGKGELNFDSQTKIEFSGAFYSYPEVDVLNLLIRGKIPSDFGIIFAQSSNEMHSGIKFEKDAMILKYPENTFEWGAPYFTINALNKRVKEMDFKKYNKVILEMKGEHGGEQFFLTMKDKYDPPDGSESRVDITVTKNWETYEVSLDQFETADMKIIEIPIAFVFIGNIKRIIYVRSIQYN